MISVDTRSSDDAHMYICMHPRSGPYILYTPPVFLPYEPQGTSDLWCVRSQSFLLETRPFSGQKRQRDMSYSLNSLKGMIQGLLYGILRGMLGV